MAEYIWDNPKIGFCALRCDKMYIHFFGGKTTVNVIIYHVTLELFLMPLLLDNKQTNKQTFFSNIDEHHISTWK